VQVKHIGYAMDKVDGLMSNVRVGEIMCKDENSVPDTLQWQFDGLSGRAIIFVQGRPPRCHRCGDRSHKVAQCLATRSYASAARLEVDEDTGGYEDAQTEMPVHATVVQQAENIVHQQSEAFVEPETAPQQPVGEHDRPTSWAEQTAAEESSVLHKQSEPESEESSGEDHDHDGDDEAAGTKEVDDDGFVRPTSLKRRQRHIKRAVGSMELKTATATARDSEGASKRLRSQPENLATATSSASTVMDPTTGRQHSRTRVPSGRRASSSAATL